MGIRPDSDVLKRNKRAIYDAATNFQATDLERALVLAMAMVGPTSSVCVAKRPVNTMATVLVLPSSCICR